MGAVLSAFCVLATEAQVVYRVTDLDRTKDHHWPESLPGVLLSHLRGFIRTAPHQPEIMAALWGGRIKFHTWFPECHRVSSGKKKF